MRGVQDLGETAVPLGASRMFIEAERASWPERLTADRDVLDVVIDLSLNGGTSWIAPYAGFTAEGGDIADTDEVGGISLASKISVPLVEPSNANRRVRGSADLKVALTTAIDLTFD